VRPACTIEYNRLYGQTNITGSKWDIFDTLVSLQTVWRTYKKGDVGIYVLYERPPVQELYLTRLAFLSTSPVQFIMFYKLPYFISYFS